MSNLKIQNRITAAFAAIATAALFVTASVAPATSNAASWMI